MSDLVEFLLARIAEDEVAARAAAPGPWTYGDIESIAGGTIYDPTVAIANVDWDPEPVDRHIRRTRPEYEADATGRHIVRWDPARVLAECAAKRVIVERETDMGGGYLSDVLFDLVQPYADHPDFDQSWRPDTPR